MPRSELPIPPKRPSGEALIKSEGGFFAPVGQRIQYPEMPAPPAPEGKKFDSGKPRWSLLPRGTLRKVIQVLEAGAVKYDVDNWKSVPDARTRYYDAMNRHIEAWWGGEKQDPETGIHHLAHATCCALFLMWLDEPVDGPAQ